MFCPQCKAEYRVGFIRCSDCDIELVDHLPVEKPAAQPEVSRQFEPDRFEPEAKLVVVGTYPSVLDADLARTVLEAAGIDSMIREGGVSRQYLPPAITGSIELLVRAEDAEDAEKILELDVANEDETTD